MTWLKQGRTGNTLSTARAHEVREVNEGDRRSAIETQRGVMVTSHDPQLERTMANAERVIARFRKAYEALADA